MHITIIGAGLAGAEASYQLASRGVKVTLIEMRPIKHSPAHQTDRAAELVCSNTFRSNDLKNAVGVMKEEMRQWDSLIIRCADKHRIPAGGALAVDREGFSSCVHQALSDHPNITLKHEIVENIPEGPTIIATGPLTDDALMQDIKRFTGEESAYFYDAAAPILDASTINTDICFRKSRWDEENEGDYLNCPMNEEEYKAFYEALINAETAPIKDFELKVFEGCMPIEEMARRGEQTMLFGPLKPVGLMHEGVKHHAVIQLRQDDARQTMYNVVGFQTHLKFGEQKRILRMVPGLENAEIIRYGVMHRNSFINAPNVLNAHYQTKQRDDLWMVGQLAGVEGYVESAASAIVAAQSAYAYLTNTQTKPFPMHSVIGAQADYIAHAPIKHFQPMNANFGLLPALEERHHKKERKALMAKRALEAMKRFRHERP